jgi:Ca2+-binding RTX toxin-like protein
VKTVVGTINLVGSSGNDVLIGNSSAQTITGNAGNDTMDGKGGADTLNGGIGNDTYIYNLGYGANTISDYDATAGNVDTLSFGSGISGQNLWFARNGSNLVVTVLGSSNTVTINNWYSGTANDLEEFTTTDGLRLDSQLTQLVSAMATYSAANSNFSPSLVMAMPTDATLQTAIAAAWHT